MKNNKLYGNWFCGNEASEYAKEQGYLDYSTFAKAFDAVLANDIISKTYNIGFWEEINLVDNSDKIEDSESEIFQYFIVSDVGAELILEYTDDPLYYNDELNLYVWGITHLGTAWDYVLTDIKLNCGEEAFK